MVKIQIHANAAAAAQAAAQIVCGRLSAHSDKQRFLLALSGGNTPKLMYEHLRTMPDAGTLLNNRSLVFFSDERAVPPQSEQSNYRMAKIELLDPLGIDPAIVHRMRGEANDLQAEATRYELLIHGAARAAHDHVPQLDLILLGMGSDGHTASLFPDHDWQATQDALVAAPWVTSQKSSRLTFTLKLINASKTVLFLAAGVDKAGAVKKVLSAEIEADILPAGRVEASETIWIIDQAAASQLDTSRARGPVSIC